MVKPIRPDDPALTFRVSHLPGNIVTIVNHHIIWNYNPSKGNASVNFHALFGAISMETGISIQQCTRLYADKIRFAFRQAGWIVTDQGVEIVFQNPDSPASPS